MAVKRLDFNRDIRPILSDTCFKCHGPDEKQRMANLRLDETEGLFTDRGGYRIIVPGNAAQSKLYQKISSTDESFRMPPTYSGRSLTAKQIELIKEWIDQGAKWEMLWSFVPPKRPPVPEVKDKDWPRNPIDNFVLARLESEGLKPSPEADKATLLRRVYFDLTGLPPTPAEIDAFVADRSPDAYEKRVDQLLASPHYGERMAMPWLDMARYADTHGYHIDSLRDMWAWRDWVIKAFNQNLPYDEFTVEQIAGDLLPNATMDQKIASGFNRNHMITLEGGAIPAGVPRGVRGRSRQHHVHRLPGPHHGVCALPRSQIRPHHAEGFLSLLCFLQHCSGARPGWLHGKRRAGAALAFA